MNAGVDRPTFLLSDGQLSRAPHVLLIPILSILLSGEVPCNHEHIIHPAAA
jgi:hypothetical protein